MSKAIAIFAKAPLPGRVKTRLQTCLTAAQSADLHAAFVIDAWERLVVLSGDLRLYLYCDRPWETFEHLAGSENFRLQQGADLGTRMLRSMQELSAQGHDRVVLLGSDSPTLPTGYVEQAFTVLDQTDTVLGPADDGGYYAVGCRRSDPDMFAGVSWSSSDTLRATQAAFRARNLTVSMLPQWYDVDTEADLVRLAAEPVLPPSTRGWFDRNPDVKVRLAARW